MYRVQNKECLFFAGTEEPESCHEIWGWECPVWEENGSVRVLGFAREDVANDYAEQWGGHVVED